MPLTLAHIWTLLGICYLCILLGNTNVNAKTEEIEIGQKVQDRNPPNLRAKKPSEISDHELPASIRNIMAKEALTKYKYTFPIVSKGNIRFYDIAGVNDTKLNIFKNFQSVEGITASNRECKIQSLSLGFPYKLDEDLITNCPHLNLTLKGKNWRCLEEGRMLQNRGVVVDMSLAKCTDVWHDNAATENRNDNVLSYEMEEGIQKVEEFGITNCPDERCACKWYFKGDSYTVNVDCDGRGLTDDSLPALPDKVVDVRMERNTLRSMDKLIKHLLPYNDTLKVLRLDYNQLDILPRLPNATFPRIIDISLINNNIEKIDIEVFEELTTRKDLAISLEGNPFLCNCNLYKFKIFLQNNYVRHWYPFKALMYTKCKSKNEHKTEILSLSKEICNTAMDLKAGDGWLTLNITLGILNFIMIILMMDLICHLTHIGGKKERQPMMDRVVCIAKCVMCYLRPTPTEVTTPVDNDYEEQWRL